MDLIVTEITENSTDKPSRRPHWIRLLYVGLFAIIYWVAEVVLVAIVVIQFGFVLISGERNDKLLQLGAGVSKFIYQILRFVTFNTDSKPFPFSDWPAENDPA